MPEPDLLKTELQAIWVRAWPVSLATLFQMLTFVVDLAFLGQLGTKELAGASIAQVTVADCCNSS
jgi:Na+-driven multidrug efflux pump